MIIYKKNKIVGWINIVMGILVNILLRKMELEQLLIEMVIGLMRVNIMIIIILQMELMERYCGKKGQMDLIQNYMKS